MPYMHRPIEADVIYTREEAAEILKIGLSTLKRWIASGQLEVSRLEGSRRILIKGSSILEMLERTRVKPKTPGD
jgi:excisionase family DNA binding protein